jgi:DNA polymerase elongation subunit (family B)
MSYLSAITLDDVVRVWERGADGERTTVDYNAPYYFYVDDPNGKHKTIYDTSVAKVDCGRDRSLFYKKRKQFASHGVQMWESDIPTEIRVLSNTYHKIPAPKLHVSFLDIEVDYNLDQGFSGPKNPYAPINAMSIFHEHTQTMIALAVPPNDGVNWTEEMLRQACEDIVPLDKSYETVFHICKDERELLEWFIAEIQDSDLLCGWNSERFDFPFIGKRIEIVLGVSRLRDLSFYDGGDTTFVEVEDNFNKFKSKDPNAVLQTFIKLELSGRMLADYMLLYKKYEMSEKPSYKLETISEDVLVDENDVPLLPKLHYEGSLHSLYINDFAFFVRYNIRDSEILHGFEQKLAYVELANQMYHLSCGLFQHVSGTLKLAELAIVNHCHHVIKRVVNNIKTPLIDRQIEGALVLLPQIGMHEMIGSIDINSLYPTAIRSINISPEKLMGQFIETVDAYTEIKLGSDVELTFVYEKTQESVTATAAEWKEYFIAMKWAISGYGTAFNQDAPGIIPTVLTTWFTQRKYYQKLKKEAEIAHDEEKVAYYDRLQYVYKIKLNSLYGALANLHFRFFDVRMGESTTGTSRMILKHQCRTVNQIFEGKYDIEIPMYATTKVAIEKGHSPDAALDGPIFNGKFQSDCIVSGDTDSTYFKTYATNVAEAIATSDYVADVVNNSYQEFMQKSFLCQPEFDSLVKCGREVVADRGIFVEKKRYILHLVDVEGKTVDKCKVMGLDTKKTTLPVAVSKRLNRFIERYLKGEEWSDISYSIVDYKQDLLTRPDIMDIGLPKGIKGVVEYTEKFELDYRTRLPGHVAAAIHYNQMLVEYGDKVSFPIMSGMKIKVFNLKVPCGRFKSIALPTDAEFVPDWFTDNFVIDRKLHVEKLVDNPLQNILKAVDKRPPSKDSLVFEEEWEF